MDVEVNMELEQNTARQGVLANVKRMRSAAKDAAGAALQEVKETGRVASSAGKMLKDGLNEMRARNVADGRKALATLREEVKAMRQVKSLPQLVRLTGEQTARNLEAVSAVASRNAGELRELVTARVAPLVVGRAKANFARVRSSANA